MFGFAFYLFKMKPTDDLCASVGFVFIKRKRQIQNSKEYKYNNVK